MVLPIASTHPEAPSEVVGVGITSKSADPFDTTLDSPPIDSNVGMEDQNTSVSLEDRQDDIQDEVEVRDDGNIIVSGLRDQPVSFGNSNSTDTSLQTPSQTTQNKKSDCVEEKKRKKRYFVRMFGDRKKQSNKSRRKKLELPTVVEQAIVSAEVKPDDSSIEVSFQQAARTEDNNDTDTVARQESINHEEAPPSFDAMPTLKPGQLSRRKEPVDETKKSSPKDSMTNLLATGEDCMESLLQLCWNVDKEATQACSEIESSLTLPNHTPTCGTKTQNSPLATKDLGIPAVETFQEEVMANVSALEMTLSAFGNAVSEKFLPKYGTELAEKPDGHEDEEPQASNLLEDDANSNDSQSKASSSSSKGKMMARSILRFTLRLGRSNRSSPSDKVDNARVSATKLIENVSNFESDLLDNNMISKSYSNISEKATPGCAQDCEGREKVLPMAPLTLQEPLVHPLAQQQQPSIENAVSQAVSSVFLNPLISPAPATEAVIENARANPLIETESEDASRVPVDILVSGKDSGATDKDTTLQPSLSVKASRLSVTNDDFYKEKEVTKVAQSIGVQEPANMGCQCNALSEDGKPTASTEHNFPDDNNNGVGEDEDEEDDISNVPTSNKNIEEENDGAQPRQTAVGDPPAQDILLQSSMTSKRTTKSSRSWLARAAEKSAVSFVRSRTDTALPNAPIHTIAVPSLSLPNSGDGDALEPMAFHHNISLLCDSAESSHDEEFESDEDETSSTGEDEATATSESIQVDVYPIIIPPPLSKKINHTILQKRIGESSLSRERSRAMVAVLFQNGKASWI